MEEKSKLDELTVQVAEMLSKEYVDPDNTLGEIGLDSLNIVELILICEQLYPNLMDPQALSFDEHTTLREVDQQMIKNA